MVNLSFSLFTATLAVVTTDLMVDLGYIRYEGVYKCYLEIRRCLKADGLG